MNEFRGLKRNAAFWLLTGFGAGLLRPAPGTWGSLLGLGLGYILLILGIGFWGLLAAAILLSILAIPAIKTATASIGGHDHSEIVIDEVAGQWLAMLPIAASLSATGLVMAFVLFRFFDIVKPWPIYWVDKKMTSAAGVMIDDLLAGAVAAFVLWHLMAWQPGWF